MPNQKESVQPLERPNAQTPEGATKSDPVDTSIVRQAGYLVKFCMVLISAAMWALLTAVWALPAAWAERGWRGGVGGEWLLILAAGWFGGWLCATCYHMAAGDDKEENENEHPL